MTYAEFLANKEPRVELSGTEPGPLHESLFPFQRAITEWAIRLGRAAIFSDCGTGKARMSLEWARHFAGRVLVVAPLGVAYQTINEGAAIDVKVRRVTEPDDEPGISITNYERLHKFVEVPYDAIVLDESSILKSFAGKTRTMLLKEFTSIPRRLCCTATPSPNDIIELANHAEFLGVMSRVEMLATYFVHDSKAKHGTGKSTWRLKGHASEAMYEWMAGWSVYVRHPSDIGFDDEGFILPPLTIRDETVYTDWCPGGQLFPTGLGGIGARSRVRRYTMDARIERAAELITVGSLHDGAVVPRPGQWLVWCGLNDEGRGLKKILGDEAVLVEGSDSEETKLARERAWRAGEVRTMISKSKIFGFGLNWQHCRNMMFLGIGDSFEAYYQAIRRCWRFGQSDPVNVHIVVSSVEGEISANVKRKESEAAQMAMGVIAAMKDKQTAALHGARHNTDVYETAMASGDGWKLLLGDSVERIAEIETDSVGLSVYSPPFASLFTYSASSRDMSNCSSHEEFFEHYNLLIPEILRVTMPGRRTAVHVTQMTTTKTTHGVIGWRDFRAEVVRAYIDAGWVYDGEIVIDKDPQSQAIRTKVKGLMFIQKERDASWLRPAMADYILLFRHPADNEIPVKVDVTDEEWILWARPIWYDIRETEILKYSRARDALDEKHICPLQLGTIRRCIRLWSNGDDLVFDPFAGIGSTGHVALELGRSFVGIELKRSYYNQACKHLEAARSQMTLW